MSKLFCYEINLIFKLNIIFYLISFLILFFYVHFLSLFLVSINFIIKIYY